MLSLPPRDFQFQILYQSEPNLQRLLGLNFDGVFIRSLSSLSPLSLLSLSLSFPSLNLSPPPYISITENMVVLGFSILNSKARIYFDVCRWIFACTCHINASYVYLNQRAFRINNYWIFLRCHQTVLQSPKRLPRQCVPCPRA